MTEYKEDAKVDLKYISPRKRMAMGYDKESESVVNKLKESPK